MPRSLPRLALGLTALAAVLAPSLAPAPADASQYVLPHTKVVNRTVKEGGLAKYVMRIPECRYKECTYPIHRARNRQGRRQGSGLARLQPVRLPDPHAREGRAVERQVQREDVDRRPLRAGGDVLREGRR